MKVYNVSDREFKEYGTVLTGYDYTELFSKLKDIDIPKQGISYTSSLEELESCSVAKEFELRGFGAYPVQLGSVRGFNKKMNCLEYHKSSEFNIAMDDIILVLALEKDICDGVIDSSVCKAFFVPAGTGVELYATTLHYAPFNISKNGYRVVCVLPRGTNGEKINFDNKNIEDKFCFGVNKWLLAHSEAPEINSGAQIGIKGINIDFDMLGD